MRTPLIAWRAVVAAIALTMTMSACSSASTDSVGTGANAASPEVRIGVGIDASYAPLFLADEKGLFEKAGVNVKLVQFGSGGEAADAFAGGQVQFAGLSDVTTIGRLPQNPDMRALLLYQVDDKYLKVVERKGVSDAKQIKKMAIVPGVSQLAAIRFLESKNIDPKSVKFVTAAPPEIPALLQKGDVDAFVLWEPWPTKAVELGGKIAETTGDFGVLPVHWLVTGAKWLKGNQDTAAKVAKAIEEAATMTEQDPQAAAQATQKATKIPAAQTLTAIKEIQFGARGFTAADLKGYESTAQFYVDTDTAKSVADVETAVLQNWFTEHVGK
ncbi:ABC transporter substrate-binding protein [Streptomyces sp. 2A115]|uniref:ABC transporter substrate-binding protein n=1 Tax=Streptomyces sp. 2A115 TaxID=3457439 RepID=UPI003FD65661